MMKRQRMGLTDFDGKIHLQNIKVFWGSWCQIIALFPKMLRLKKDLTKKSSGPRPYLCHLVGQLFFSQEKYFLYEPIQNISICRMLGFSIWNADFLFFQCRWVVGNEWLSCDMPHARLDHVDGQQWLHECLDVATAREAADREATRGQLHATPVVATGASQPWKGARRAAVRHCQGPIGRQQRGTH